MDKVEQNIVICKWRADQLFASYNNDNNVNNNNN